MVVYLEIYKVDMNFGDGDERTAYFDTEREAKGFVKFSRAQGIKADYRGSCPCMCERQEKI